MSGRRENSVLYYPGSESRPYTREERDQKGEDNNWDENKNPHTTDTNSPNIFPPRDNNTRHESSWGGIYPTQWPTGAIVEGSIFSPIFSTDQSHTAE